LPVEAFYTTFAIVLARGYFARDGLKTGFFRRLRRRNEVETRVQVVLYTKPECHLCEQMKEVMSSSGCEELYSLEEVDIESDAELFALYQYEIPVLFINGVEAFRHNLRPDEFKAYVTALVDRRT
jgi:glutaredoxin